jgi:hypothetical protein
MNTSVQPACERPLTSDPAVRSTVLLGRRYWVTPPDVMAKLHAEFDFDFDPCPHPRPEGFDGLVVPWGKRNWVNPPFMGGMLKWARKAIAEWKQGKLCVFLCPQFQPRSIDLLGENGAEVRYAGRIRFLALEDGKPNPTKDVRGYILLILRPNTELSSERAAEQQQQTETDARRLLK